MTSVVKWVPRSELTLKGSPNLTFTFTFSHLADAFIQSDLQLGTLHLEKMWFINRQAVVSAVSLGAGRHSIHFVNSQTTVRKYLLPRVDRGRVPAQSIWRSDHGKVIPFLFSSARWFGSAGWTWQHNRASFYIFCYVLLHARPVCYLLECFVGGLGTMVSCAWCIVGVCQHNPPLALRDYELWRSEGLRDICENICA